MGKKLLFSSQTQAQRHNSFSTGAKGGLDQYVGVNHPQIKIMQ